MNASDYSVEELAEYTKLAVDKHEFWVATKLRTDYYLIASCHGIVNCAFRRNLILRSLGVPFSIIQSAGMSLYYTKEIQKTTARVSRTDKPRCGSSSTSGNYHPCRPLQVYRRLRRCMEEDPMLLRWRSKRQAHRKRGLDVCVYAGPGIVHSAKALTEYLDLKAACWAGCHHAHQRDVSYQDYLDTLR